MNRILAALHRLGTDARWSGLPVMEQRQWLLQQDLDGDAVDAIRAGDGDRLAALLGIDRTYLCVLFPKDDGKSPQRDEEEEIRAGIDGDRSRAVAA